MAVGELLLAAFFQVLFDRLATYELLNFARQEWVWSKLNKWRKMLLMIQAVLNDAEEKQLTDMTVKMWLDDLRDLAYDVEDILDEFATEALRCNLKAGHLTTISKVRKLVSYSLTSFTPSVVKFNFSMGPKIKGITMRLEELCEQRIKLGLQIIPGGGGTSTAVRKIPPSTSVPTEPAVYGRDEDKLKIVEMVLSNEPNDANFHVISIVGMAGIGKTTLAREVYNDKALEDFNPKAWVCVSDDFDVFRISKAVLESITSKSCDLKDLNQVQIQLKGEVARKKFFLVLDDVWSQDYGLWEALKSPFMAGAPGSKIILTTRHVDVALTMGLIDECYNLDLLSNDDCWSVFMMHAFARRDGGAQRDIEIIRGKVVEKCRGLPLAARTLGGLLRSKQRDGAWEDILNSKIWDLHEESGILPVLRLSYYHLPSHLKRCFAYCAIFPKDYEFEEEELVLLWMAEGLIQPSDNDKQLEDLGREYFHDLLSRSIFQQSSSSRSKFVMHNLINDLAQLVSGETSFRLEEVNKRSKNFKRARHSSYTCGDCDGKNKFVVFHEVEHLRTFLPILMSGYSRYSSTLHISDMVLSDLLPKLKKLRVLSLKKYYITELPDSIKGLRHLRYLNLSGIMIRNLPESISSLLNLEILILKDCSRLTKLPSDIWNLINLRHFDIRGVNLIREMPLGMKELNNLQMLSNFVVGKGTGSSLKDLKNLKFLRGELCISRLENVTDLQDTREAILVDKKGLEVLLLQWGSQFDNSRNEAVEQNVLDMLQPHKNIKEFEIQYYGGARFPSWIGDPSFSSMTVLTLESCKSCASLPSLGLLGSLKNLTIKGMTALRSIGFEIYGEGCSKPFQSLETLCFENLVEWQHWDARKTNEHVEIFSRLRKLSIIRCPKLSSFTTDHLPSLQTLVIIKCDQLVVSFSSLPMVCNLEISGCKGMVCKSPIESLKSLTLSNISERLHIAGCEELIYLWQNSNCLIKPPQVLHNLTSLKELCIEDCPSLVSFPDSGFLSTLIVLIIKNCNALTSLHEGMKHNRTYLQDLRIEGCHSLIFIIRGQLPSSLKRMQIINCDKLQFLLDDRVDTCTPSSSSMMDKAILESLDIFSCPSFTCLSSRGQSPVTVKHLQIVRCSELTILSSDQLPEELEYLKIRDCSKLGSIAERFHSNAFLREIKLWNCRNLKSIPEGLHNLSRLQQIVLGNCPSLVSFPEGGLPNTNLIVSIRVCEKFNSLPKGMHNLNCLQELQISKCPCIISFPQDGFPTNITSLTIEDLNIYKSLIEWGLHRLTSLRRLDIGGCLDAVSFPQEEMGMMLPTSLTELVIGRFPKLKYLSSRCFQTLTSLEYLSICNCPKLKSFPAVGLPSSLLGLYIDDCPLLGKHCKRNKGQEWPKLAHIPCVMIDGKFKDEE